MALIFLGKTKCALCQQVLEVGSEVAGLPPSPYTNHPLYVYFDQGFHKKCYENWDKKETVEGLVQKAIDEFIESDSYKEAEKKYGKPKWVEERSKTASNKRANKSACE